MTRYGWNNSLRQLQQASIHKTLPYGRVTVVHRTCYDIISENGLFQCELTGNMLYGKSAAELPCTGDWVLFQPLDEDKGIIVDMLPRERTLYRRKSGTVADKQAIAAYVDKAFIVQSLDDNFNVRRAERFMVQILEEKIQPVLVLNKADLAFDSAAVTAAIQHLRHQMPVFFTSIHQPETLLALKASIAAGETVVFTGSSGVGKSSLVNALCDQQALLTSHISESTGKGRHTSTRREMVLMEGAGVLIDTPGVREFGLVLDNPDLLEQALEISDYAAACRFRDCQHINEAGCAVIAAVQDGNLDPKVYESYLKLRREAWHYSASKQEKKKWEKSLSRMVEEAKNISKH